MQQKNKGNAGIENDIVSKTDKLFSIKFHNKAMLAKVILPTFLLFSTTVITSVSNPVQPVSAISFEKTKNLSNDPGRSLNPKVEASGNNVYTVWSDESKGDFETFFKRSTDAGNSFHSTLDLSNGKDNPASDASEPQIVKEGNNVYVVWSDEKDVFYKRSTNGGASFGSTINLSNDNNPSLLPQIAVVGKNVYVVWVGVESGAFGESQLFFKKSTNGGASFGSVKKISDTFVELRPRIAASGENVYVSFTGGSGFQDGEVFFTRSINEGSSFTKAVSINKNDENSFIGDFAAAGKYVYIIWNDASLDGRHVFFIRSANNGASFDNIKDFGPSDLPYNQLDTISNNVYAVWNDKDGGILFKASTNNGASFGSTKTLSDSGIVPQISSSGDAVRIVWIDNVDGQPDVFFRASGNEGSSFGSIKNLSNSEGGSYGLKIISSGGNIYVVWEEDLPRNTDIFFKKGVD